MASEVEIEVSQILLVPECPYELFIAGQKILPQSSIFSSNSLSFQLKLKEDLIDLSLELVSDISEYTLPISSQDYNGSLTLVLLISQVLEIEDPSDISFNCRYLKNISASEAFHNNTNRILAHLEELMGANYSKMLEDVARPSSPVRSPNKKVSKPGNKTPASKSPYKRSLSGVSFDQGGVIEIPCSSDIYMDKVSGKDTHSLILIVASLLAKRRLLKSADIEDEIIKNIINNNQKASEVMKAAFEETKTQLQLEKDEIWYQIQLTKDQIAELQKKNEQLKHDNQELSTEKAALVNDVNTNTENIQLLRKMSVEKSGELLNEISSIRKLTQETENQRQDIQGLYTKYLTEFKSEMTDKDREISKKQDNLNKSITEFNQKDIQLTHIVQENTKIKGQILQITSELIVKMSHNDRCSLLSNLIKEDSTAVEGLKIKLEESLAKYKEICRDTEIELDDIRSAKESLDKNQEKTKEIFEQATKEEETLNNTLQGLKQSLEEIHELYHQTAQIEQSFNALQRRLIFSYENKEHSVKELKYLSDLILHLTSCYTSAHRSFIKATNLLEQKNCEIVTIYEALAELKKKYPVYFPIKDDVIDFALGNYLNGRDLGLSVPFIREANGIYFFGTKKILINYERMKLTVKVGGGFLPIEEFINAYSDVEVEKFMSKCQELSPKTKRFLGKWVAGLVDNTDDQKKAKDLLVHAAEEHKYTVSYAVRADRSVSPLRKSNSITN